MATAIPVTDTYHMADGSVPPSGSKVTFTLTAPLTDTVTGVVISADPVVARLDGTALAVTLYATDDPTTSPVGTTYLVEERIGTEARSYYVAVPYNAGSQVLGLLAPADVAPAVTYGLSSIVATLPLSAVRVGGVVTLSLDSSNFATDAELTAEANARDAADTTLTNAISAEASTARAAESANAGAISSHAAETTGAHGGVVASTDPRLTDSRAPTAHASTHITGGGDVIATAVAGGAAGLLSGTDKTKLDGIAAGAQPGTVTSVAATVPGVLFSIGGSPITGAGTLALSLLTQTANTVLAGPTSGDPATPTMRGLVAADLPDLSAVYLPVARLTGGGVLATAGFTLTVPATGTAALVGTDNVFSVAQGVRGAASGVAAGLHVPWVTGDALPAIMGGASTAGNAQTGVLGRSDSGVGVSGTSSSGQAVQGSSATGSGVLGIMSGAGSSALEARYTGSATNVQTGLILRNSTSGTGAAGTGSAINFLSKTTTTNSRFQAQMVSSWAVPTEGSQTGRWVVNTFDSAVVAREILRGEASGTAPMIGFLGANAQARTAVTGSRGGNAALASLLTALAAFGLITDSSSA